VTGVGLWAAAVGVNNANHPMAASRSAIGSGDAPCTERRE